MSNHTVSAGHIGFSRDGKTEVYEIDGEVYRAPIVAVVDVHTHARIGRWECSVEHFYQYRNVAYSWVVISECETERIENEDLLADDPAGQWEDWE